MTNFFSIPARLATRFFARNLVVETIPTLLGRPLTSDELERYTARCRQEGLAGLVSSIIGSADGFAGALLHYDEPITAALEEALAQDMAVATTIRGRDENGTHAILVEKIRTLTRTDEHWRDQLGNRTSEIVDAACNALLPDSDSESRNKRMLAVDLKSTADLRAMLESISTSAEHWRKQVESRAAEIVTLIYRTLLGRAADQHEQKDGAALVHATGDLDNLLTALGASRSLWKAQVARNADRISEPIASRFLGKSADSHVLEYLSQELKCSGEVSDLLTTLASLPAYERHAFARFAPELTTQLFLHLLHRLPTELELAELGSPLQTASDFGSVISKLLRLIQTTSIESTISPLAATNSSCDDEEQTAELEGYDSKIRIVEGFYENESNFTWSQVRSKIIAHGDARIYLACNYLRPQEKRVVSVFDGGDTHTLTIDNPFGCHEIKFMGTQARVISFAADGAHKPSSDGLSEDHRDLAFQLYESVPQDKYISQRTAYNVPIILFVADEKKEVDSIRPVYDQLRRENLSVQFLDANAAIEYTKANYTAVCGYVISSSSTYTRLFNAGCRSSFIYLEHGVSPVKRYTYAAHYRRYDVALLPGAIWTDRLEKLYPEMHGRCENVGYAKLRPLQQLSEQDRAIKCRELGLDPNRPVILFAPTWSGGDEECGVFNLRYFELEENLLTVPHDGDVQFCQIFDEQGYKIAWPTPGILISEYYNLADILISDISSTAIEFASLGKPVICLKLNNIQDFDLRNIEEDGRLRIPHTEQYWDFCDWSSPQDLAENINQLKENGLPNDLLEARRESAEKIISCCGDASTEKSATAIKNFFKKKQDSYYPIIYS
jgi:hypothetical protein